MINATCHGCSEPMNFEAVPVTLTEMTGETITHYGHNGAAWICKVCREIPSLLQAARLAAGLPAKPSLPSEFDDNEC